MVDGTEAARAVVRAEAQLEAERTALEVGEAAKAGLELAERTAAAELATERSSHTQTTQRLADAEGQVPPAAAAAPAAAAGFIYVSDVARY